jgi:hypothetical protein
MATKPNLRAVSPGETAPKPVVLMSLVEAVELGDYLEILRAQRRDIATSLPDEKGPAKAALHRQLSIIAKEIEFIEAGNDRDAREVGSGAEVSDAAFGSRAI